MTNHHLQNKLLQLLENGYTVLAETEKFVNQIQLQFRLRRLEEGKSGWDTPQIFTLNHWMENYWKELWPEELPASSTLLRWKYLRECLDEARPPEPLVADVELIQLLDESFEQCLRYGLDQGGQDVNRLVEWRRRIWQSFDDRLATAKLFHPAQLPEKITRCLMPERMPGHGQMAFVGFEFAGQWEKCLIDELKKTLARYLTHYPRVMPVSNIWSIPTRSRKLWASWKTCFCPSDNTHLTKSRLSSWIPNFTARRSLTCSRTFSESP